MKTGSASGGPWIFEDGIGRRYLVQVVPMERDDTMDESLQPKAVVFQTDEGWIRVSPVGHDFALEELSREEILSILRHMDAGPTGDPVG